MASCMVRNHTPTQAQEHCLVITVSIRNQVYHDCRFDRLCCFRDDFIQSTVKSAYYIEVPKPITSGFPRPMTQELQAPVGSRRPPLGCSSTA
jgi:hypothetical protein